MFRFQTEQIFFFYNFPDVCIWKDGVERRKKKKIGRKSVYIFVERSNFNVMLMNFIAYTINFSISLTQVLKLLLLLLLLLQVYNTLVHLPFNAFEMNMLFTQKQFKIRSFQNNSEKFKNILNFYFYRCVICGYHIKYTLLKSSYIICILNFYHKLFAISAKKMK